IGGLGNICLLSKLLFKKGILQNPIKIFMNIFSLQLAQPAGTRGVFVPHAGNFGGELLYALLRVAVDSKILPLLLLINSQKILCCQIKIIVLGKVGAINVGMNSLLNFDGAHIIRWQLASIISKTCKNENSIEDVPHINYHFFKVQFNNYKFLIFKGPYYTILNSSAFKEPIPILIIFVSNLTKYRTH
ncbi:hypothetical protein ACJX0J_028644, partial [Zea mays]